MKKLLLAIAILTLAVASYGITLVWEPNPAEENITAYRVYQSTNAAGPWDLVAVTTNTTYTMPLPPGRYFWYVCASNFWSEAQPSNSASTPAPATKTAAPTVSK